MKLLLVAGARPNFMKVAPLIHEIERRNRALADGIGAIEYSLVHTGQHYDPLMSDVFFRELQIPPPHHHLEVGSGSHACQTANVMLKFEPVLQSERPDWLVVVGDVNSTMGCALVASKLGTRVAHVEAGLRSFDRTMPEEINRLVTDSIADLLLTPSEDADENLRREGVPESKIRLVGNIMIDALVQNLPGCRASTILRTLGVEREKFAYVTLHRPANVDDRVSLGSILDEVAHLSEQLPVIFPMHPRTRKMVSQYGLAGSAGDRIHLLDPVGYHDSLCLTEAARFVLTDSGGLQEESTFFRTPCLTLRLNTERPVTLTVGSNKLTRIQSLRRDIEELLGSEPRKGSIPRLWDGKTAERVVGALLAA